MAEKIKVTIDGTEHEVEAGENILQVCLDKGMLIPHFCYHEAMGPLGACRLCAANIAPAADKPGRLEMTCMTRASAGMVINVNDEYATKFRKSVIEDLMLNHPHDCPVCDEGGECMLQDMTVITEHQHRRTRFPKRTWKNQYLGPLVHHEMNRCITCYRCVRYYGDYALGSDLGAYGSRNRVYFGRLNDGVLESEFSGNLIDVCPTGVFTNKRFREVYTRPWDLQTARSVCVSCSVGCNVLPGFRHTDLRRIKPAENDAVNKYFMCDRGRYGGEFVNLPSRLSDARVSGTSMMTEDGIDAVAAQLKDIATKHGAGAIAGLGSQRASLEANAALTAVLKALGSDRVACFGSQADREAARLAASITASRELPTPSLPGLEKADFVLSVGGDLTAEAPMLDLAIRQAVRQKAPLFIVSPRAGSLDKFATASLRTAPGTEAGIVKEIAAGGGKDFVAQVATALKSAKSPVILCSTLHGDAALVGAVYQLAKSANTADRPCGLAYYYKSANTAGVALARKDESPEAIAADAKSGKIKALVVLERNAAAEPALAEAIAQCEYVVAIDCYENATTNDASAVLPCVAHYQSFGTILNFEGRAQHFSGLNIPGSATMASSEVLLNIAERLGASEIIQGLDFHDVYDITTESGKAVDGIRTGDSGALVKSDSKPTAPPSAKPASTGMVAWHIHHTFGSEELSAMSPPIAELAPAAGLELNPEDAKSRNLSDGQNADLTKEFGVSGLLTVNAGLAKGTLGIRVIQTAVSAPRKEVTA
ncbi:MAG: NADH-quinone oxidoreductase subunit NuoG [Candidatus Sumerlaeaceae bacterium]|nr:NADH-quinone oxidoreductase subunit NuoG [Candidatus Sumerlaeaceae bacterium]